MATIAEALAVAQQYQQAGHLREAEHIYRQIVQADPSHAEALRNLGAVSNSLSRVEADGANDRGIALAHQGRLDEAISSFQDALRSHPDHEGAHNNLGIVFAQCARFDEAVVHYKQALRIRSDFFEAYSNLGNALRDLGKFDEAINNYAQATRLRPDFAEAYNNWGIALVRQDRLDEAADMFRKTLELRPNYAKAHSNLGNVLRDLGQLVESLACYNKALRLQPDHADAYRNRALVHLLRGNFEQGWRDYAWRWHCQDMPTRPFQQPLWDGSSLAGRTILLGAEQGLGDTIQFARYAALVKDHGGTVVLECPRLLCRLLGQCRGIDRLVPQGDLLPEFDVHASLLDLPRILGTTLATIPANIPYLVPDAEPVERWRCELAPLRGFKIGITWRGGPHYEQDRQRSASLAAFTHLARIEGIRLVSLQKGPGTEELAQLAGPLGVIDLGNQLDETTGAFMDTTAIMQHLDLVVSVDTAVAHCAGALGVPVWVLLPFAPDWRWLLDREDSPWYPTMRLFRQRQRGNWDDVLQRVTKELAAIVR